MMAHRETLSAPLADVVDLACAASTPEECELVAAFVPLLLAEIHEDDLAARADALAKMSLELLRFGRRRAPDQILVGVDRDSDPKTSLLMAVTLDAPFLVDTMRLVLERLGLSTSFMIHPMIDVV